MSFGFGQKTLLSSQVSLQGSGEGKASAGSGSCKNRSVCLQSAALENFVIRDQQKKEALYEAYPRDWFVKAPVILVICVDRTQSWKRGDGKDYGDVDIAIAVDHMTLAAADLGLGTC